MARNFFIFLILFVFSNCSSDTIKKSEIIDDDEFIEVLKDFHKSVGIINIAKLNDKKNKNDTISPYNYILKKHNISREKFDKTVQYYANNTEEYIPFYDSINSYFLKEKTKLEKQLEEDLKKMTPKAKFALKNLWTKKQEFIFNGIPKNNKLKFEIKTKHQGEYILVFDVFSKPKLPIFGSRIEFFATYTDGTIQKSKKRKKTNSPKNKKYDHIKLFLKTDKNKKLKTISGTIIKYKENEKRHFHLKDIEIRFVDTNKKKKVKKEFIK